MSSSTFLILLLFSPYSSLLCGSKYVELPYLSPAFEQVPGVGLGMMVKCCFFSIVFSPYLPFHALVVPLSSSLRPALPQCLYYALQHVKFIRKKYVERQEIFYDLEHLLLCFFISFLLFVHISLPSVSICFVYLFFFFNFLTFVHFSPHFLSRPLPFLLSSVSFYFSFLYCFSSIFFFFSSSLSSLSSFIYVLFSISFLVFVHISLPLLPCPLPSLLPSFSFCFSFPSYSFSPFFPPFTSSHSSFFYSFHYFLFFISFLHFFPISLPFPLPPFFHSLRYALLEIIINVLNYFV